MKASFAVNVDVDVLWGDANAERGVRNAECGIVGSEKTACLSDVRPNAEIPTELRELGAVRLITT
jgi:hypothetical protein